MTVTKIKSKDTIVRLVIDPEIRCIGVLSDSHLPARAHALPLALFARLEGVELILHAGDLVVERVLQELEELAPVVAVAGNMDPPPLRSKLHRRVLLECGEQQIGLIHGDGWRRQPRERAEAVFSRLRPQAIVFGHSHEPLCEYAGETLLFNPGSCTDPRRGQRPTCGILHLDRNTIRGEIISLRAAGPEKRSFFRAV